MAELKITDAFPGATQDDNSITLLKGDLHPTLGVGADHRLEPVLASLLWGLYERQLFPDSGFDTTSAQSISIISETETIEDDFDTGEKYLFRELRIRFREPYEPSEFRASVYG